MEIKFSRHAKRRARLYNIPESIIIDIVSNADLHQGEQEIIKNISEFKYPLKIVVASNNENATIITNYPLKKGRKK